MSKESLGDRMKFQYENRTRYKLMRRCPTIIRVDGRAFHTFTRQAKKPFDVNIILGMQAAAKALIKDIMGAKLAYVQSDEISILVTDYDDIDTQAYFDNNIQKLCSVSASVATAAFNEEYRHPHGKIATFDARVFQIADRNEVHNYFVWRYKDWLRNSMSMLAQSHFSHKELHGKRFNDMGKMLNDIGVNWCDQPDYIVYGTFFRKHGGELLHEFFNPVGDPRIMELL